MNPQGTCHHRRTKSAQFSAFISSSSAFVPKDENFRPRSLSDLKMDSSIEDFLREFRRNDVKKENSGQNQKKF
jgi:hypothetical protein